MGGKRDNEYFARLLIIIGGLIGMWAGIDRMIGGSTSLIGLNTGGVYGILYGLVLLILGLVAFLSALKPSNPIPLNIVIEIPIGILLIIIGGLWWGLISGILVVIGGILLAID